MAWKGKFRGNIKLKYKFVFMVLIILIISMISVKKVKAASTGLSEDIDYGEIQDVIDDILDSGNDFNFGNYVEKLVNGEVKFSITEILNQLLESIKGELKANLSTLGRLISIALIAAVFTNLTVAFKNNSVSETGYYITYLMLFSLLITTFINASRIASSVIGSILDFMKALVPAYFLSIGFCTGSATSLIYHEVALMLITLVDILIIKVVIPMINFYLVISLANNMSKEDMLSKLAGLFATAIDWMLKSLLAAVVGFHTIQGLILPVADRVKKSALLKASEAIPGVGNAIGGVAETILGASILLKNAIGVAGLVVIITICAVPLLKLLVINVVFRVGGATLQPISDKRIIECISASAKSSGMLLQTVLVGAVLFLLSITIAAVTTGGTF
ncbi:MAG TPA: stage III sporulation protein AF [Clostridiales bacterium]|nr:stage III sporulation protein AF [Clostridiales bacterium]